MKKETLCRASAIVFLVLFAGLWIWNPTVSQDKLTQNLATGTLRRLLGSGMLLSVLFYREISVFGRTKKGCLWVLLPAFAVALNNLPWHSLIWGSAKVEKFDLLWLYAAESLLIGIFEELAFRGILFPILLEKYAEVKDVRTAKETADPKRLFWVTVVSSAAFGLVHLLNLLEGAGAGATVMQVGYSFLIGGMCAIVLLKTGNLFWCIALHGIYDFCGGLVPKLGSGEIWSVPTVAVTAALAVPVTLWMLRVLIKKDVRTP